MIIDMIVTNRRKQILEVKQKHPLSQMTKSAFAYRATHRPADLLSALRLPGISVVAELKQCSRPDSVIRREYDPASLAAELERAGARAFSVMTEESFFKGSAHDLQAVRAVTSLPVIRRDFIFDEWQVCETCLMGADALVLSAALLDPYEMKKLIDTAGLLGLCSIAEVGSAAEIEKSRLAGAAVVCAAARDVRTFETNLPAALALRPLVPPEIPFIAAGGIRSPQEFRTAEQAGADAAMIGTALMRAESPGRMLSDITNSGRQRRSQ